MNMITYSGHDNANSPAVLQVIDPFITSYFEKNGIATAFNFLPETSFSLHILNC